MGNNEAQTNGIIEDAKKAGAFTKGYYAGYIQEENDYIFSIDTLTKFVQLQVARQAAQQQSAGEIAQYKAQIEELRSFNLELQFQNNLFMKADNEQKAQINELREALSDTNTRFNEMVDVFSKGATAKDRAVIANNYDLLSATKSSLVEHDNEVIERCAKVFKSELVRNEIRALKGK